MSPTFELEEDLLKCANVQLVAGFDEVGMGAFAGPVLVAGVILEPCHQEWYDRLDDSKKLTRTAREALAEVIARQAEAWVTVDVWPCEIDELGVYKARNQAMAEAHARLRAQLPTRRIAGIVDGSRLHGLLPQPCLYLDHADERSCTVAAASIMAKVIRDNIMWTLAGSNPGYSWERNAGYGTREHQDAIERLGPTLLHRFSFKPLRKYRDQGIVGQKEDGQC